MGRFIDALEDKLWELESDKKRFEGDEHTQWLIANMAPTLAAQIPNMDFGDDVVEVNGKKLLCLGELHYSRLNVGNIRMHPWAYLGTDGQFYIEGPRKKKFGGVIIDIHPYRFADAQGFDEGWFGGIALRELAEALVPFYI